MGLDGQMAFADLRSQQLLDHIRNDLKLLKEYEDALRFENDPRQKAKYKQNIESLHRSVEYRQEYEDLTKQISEEPQEEIMTHCPSMAILN
jgi:ABC-type Zn uptake system ZnuABC Zn-binding protein ZnuA